MWQPRGEFQCACDYNHLTGWNTCKDSGWLWWGYTAVIASIYMLYQADGSVSALVHRTDISLPSEALVHTYSWWIWSSLCQDMYEGHGCLTRMSSPICINTTSPPYCQQGVELSSYIGNVMPSSLLGQTSPAWYTSILSTWLSCLHPIGLLTISICGLNKINAMVKALKNAACGVA